MEGLFLGREGIPMSVTGIGNTTNTTPLSKDTTKVNTTDIEKTTGTATTETPKVEESTSTPTADDTAVVYDKTKLSEDDRKSIVAQLKADQEKRQSQLTDLVRDMLSKQTDTFGKAQNIWKFLAKGDFTVDAETKKKAQEDISEDGYWGVKQTSDRIVSFATALAGDDKESLQKMKDAFLKGYKQAEDTWGGELPEISKKTYDAVLEKFDKLLKPEEETKPENETVTKTEDGAVISKTE